SLLRSRVCASVTGLCLSTSLAPLRRSAFSPSLFFTRRAPPALYTLSLHDALPICPSRFRDRSSVTADSTISGRGRCCAAASQHLDRKSTRLNSSHQIISYAVFCLKKKKTDAAKRGDTIYGTEQVR